MRVNIREGHKVSTPPALVGMRSRASGAARLHACFCCFCERALALSELTTCPPSSDMRCRIVQEHVRPKSHARETRSRASRRKLSDNSIRCSAFDRGWFPAHPAQHVHRRRNNRQGRIPSHSRARVAETAKDASRHATPDAPERIDHRRRCTRNDHRTVLVRIARERVPTAPHIAKTRRNTHRRIARPCHFLFGAQTLYPSPMLTRMGSRQTKATNRPRPCLLDP